MVHLCQISGCFKFSKKHYRMLDLCRKHYRREKRNNRKSKSRMTF